MQPAPQTKAITLVLADDHPIVLNGLERLFIAEGGFEILARCGDGNATLKAVTELGPDVVVLDLRMPFLDGISALKRIRSRGVSTRVVILTASIGDEQIAEAIQLGVDAIVIKESASRNLVDCIRKVHAGERMIDQEFLGRAIGSLSRGRARRDPREALTPREIEITEMVSMGLRNKEIGTRLGISEGTVKIHLHTIYEKLEIDGRLKLTLLARETGLV